ncbi:MAG: glutathione S-transferase family protein [Deltaproteobacteria bacterium]|nr:glutathione S-transferase family protein [Deltaproteobacteria bacterium]
MSEKLTLVIGNKNYSSWSLRPWLLMRQMGIPFEEILIPLYRPETKERILRYSPSGKVPVLREGDRVVWESLSIAEYLAEMFPRMNLWPEDPVARALARSVSHEMHAGFHALRSELPMNIRRPPSPAAMSEAARADALRVQAIWRECRAGYGAGGPFLFGRFSIADAMYAPVVFRFYNYAVERDEIARSYQETLFSLSTLQEWVEAAKSEPWLIAASER